MGDTLAIRAGPGATPSNGFRGSLSPLHDPGPLHDSALYNRSIEGDGRDTRQPAREPEVQAVIVHPADGDKVAQGRRLITGWAWSASPITRVEVSTDSGASWCEAGLVERGNAPTWQRFAMNWIVTAPGAHEIRCRATDAQGGIQPVEGRNRSMPPPSRLCDPNSPPDMRVV